MTIREHEHHLGLVFQRLEEACLYLSHNNVLEPETIGVKVVHLITNGLTVTCRWQKSYQTFAAAQLRK